MTIAADPADFGAGNTTDNTGSMTVARLPGIAIAGMASLGAGAIHAAAVGIHSEHADLVRIFVATAVLQLGVGLFALIRPSRLVAVANLMINTAALTGWIITRTAGISWIDGLETSEAPQFADSAAAALAAIAIGGSLAALLIGKHEARQPRLLFPALMIAALTVPSMLAAGSHSHAEGEAAHSHGGEGTAAAATDDHADDGHDHDDGTATGATESTEAPHEHATEEEATEEHSHDDGAATSDEGTEESTDGHSHAEDTATAAWPRPWDPSGPIDVSGVDGVSIEQEVRAVKLIEESLVELPKYADTAAAIADGYASIGDAGTGTEHYIKGSLIEDDVILDATAPESLVYAVDGDKRTLTGAMYIASARPPDDPELTDFAGPLMQWHKHDNLCWDTGEDGKARVVGIIDAEGNCARGVRAGGENPMVHVWIAPHPCGVFAALEGIGAGTAAVSDEQRVDMCLEGHGDHESAAPSVAPVPYDPTKPIDLGGVEGVTLEQQARAENLVAVTLVQLPQWSDYTVAEAAGFRSIGDGATGHEHFIQWDWIDDDVWLNPNFPESLVYEPQPDGSKKLVSAMFMLPSTYALEEVPDVGGPLTQWHIHDNLCFTQDPTQPRVAGITTSGGECPAGLEKFDPAPMIHVWITPHPCGPFAALEGVGAGQIAEGETRLCDTADGSH